jgi:hypothetical protein
VQRWVGWTGSELGKKLNPQETDEVAFPRELEEATTLGSFQGQT